MRRRAKEQLWHENNEEIWLCNLWFSSTQQNAQQKHLIYEDKHKFIPNTGRLLGLQLLARAKSAQLHLLEIKLEIGSRKWYCGKYNFHETA